MSFSLNKEKMKRNNFSKRSAKGGVRKIFKPFIFIVFLLAVVLISRGWLASLISSYKKNPVGQQGVKGEESIKEQTLTLDKKFEFPGLDDNGKEKGTLELRITDVEKTSQVIVQDKNYTAKGNKTFLIVNLELKNETTKRLNIFPGDLIRLIVDDEEKKFAPDLHNNYVQVAPISTKIDRLGFVIDQGASNLKLQVGELEEKKEILKLEF